MAFVFSSCSTSKQLTYFNDLPDSTVINLPKIKQEERVIETGDRLNISIGAKDKEAANYFIKAGGVSPEGPENMTRGSANMGNEVGYLVDDFGYIEFPIIGKVKATGLTAKQLKENLTKQVEPYLKEPLVDINFVTFRITLLGEVRSPGSFTLPAQRTTLFEALAAAGDLPRSAKRYDVHLYRDYNGQRKITKFDLRKKDVLNNPELFYLKHNDVLYVQPRPGSVLKEDATLLTSVVSILIGIVTLGFTISNN
jgi:polysaccharide export outer membrane protein